jgi:hypothetical protein
MTRNTERLMRQLRSAPRNPEIDAIKERFAALNEFVTARHGWLVSVPGDPEMRFQALPDSALPASLRAMGYIVEPIGETQRILPHAIVERFSRRADGELEPITPDSTAAVAEVRSHAGIAIVVEYDLRAPVMPRLGGHWPNLITNYLCALLYTGRNDYPSPA